jgi:hypothetical protein
MQCVIVCAQLVCKSMFICSHRQLVCVYCNVVQKIVRFIGRLLIATAADFVHYLVSVRERAMHSVHSSLFTGSMPLLSVRMCLCAGLFSKDGRIRDANVALSLWNTR